MAGKFEPKTPVQLNPPKSDPISKDFLSQCKGLLPCDSSSAGTGKLTDACMQEWMVASVTSRSRAKYLMSLGIRHISQVALTTVRLLSVWPLADLL
jgi:hypothetical protein